MNATVYILFKLILSLQPSIDALKAIEISYSTAKYCTQYKIDCKTVIGIIFTESSFRIDAKSNTNDYGLMQINKYNIRAYNLDKNRLLTDIDYNIKHGTKVFSWFYKRYNKEEAIKRYNCGVKKKCIFYKSVQNYYTKVNKYENNLN